MTIRHIVLLPFKPSVTEKEIEAIFFALAELQKKIPQIVSFSWGKNNSPEGLHRGYLHGFVMEFKNESDRKIYLEHPAHINLANVVILPSLTEGINSPIVFDYTYYT